MKTTLRHKSSVDEIRTRFDADVERFSNLETGQTATIDAPLAMELITQAAIANTPKIDLILDIGCGAGNNTIKLLQAYPDGFSCHLCDLSHPMLQRAEERIRQINTKPIRVFTGDFRNIEFEENSYDIILAAAVFHHLREDQDWENVFSKVFHLLKRGGSLWITDLVTQENRAVEEMMWRRYRTYLENLAGPDYAEKVLAYIDKEDSPRPVTWQMELMRKTGFGNVDILHKNSCFAAFGGVKP